MGPPGSNADSRSKHAERTSDPSRELPAEHDEGVKMSTLRTTIDAVRQSPAARRVLRCLLRCAVSGASARLSQTTPTPCRRE